MFHRAGKLVVAAAASAAAGAIASPSAQAQTFPDADLLNFALNLEYLGAEFYVRAVTGRGLYYNGALSLPLFHPAEGPILVPANTLVPFETPAIAYYAQRLANDELAHVGFIQDVLTQIEMSHPIIAYIGEPMIDLTTSWTTLAVAAGLIVPGQTFNPFASEVDFLLGAYFLEDLCVSAYAGLLDTLTSPANVAYTASILATEGFHAGAIRGYLSTIGAGVATDALSALRARLSGVGDNGTDANGNPFNFSNVDINGQAFRRTPQQVLAVVYGGNTSGGGFFPNGVNGTITTAAA
ncbi:MAG: ferritin-like domain-containing protein [Acidisphaera sp.]|nr:ferritin-like domain-containing protein [Acidisphaera sp.]